MDEERCEGIEGGDSPICRYLPDVEDKRGFPNPVLLAFLYVDDEIADLGGRCLRPPSDYMYFVGRLRLRWFVLFSYPSLRRLHCPYAQVLGFAQTQGSAEACGSSRGLYPLHAPNG